METSTEINKADNENKKIVAEDLNKFIKQIYPNNKLELYISPISVQNVDYITWEEYNPTGPYGTEKNNYCKPNEVGDYQYPHNEDNVVFELRNCNNYFTEEIKDMLDLNSYITKSYTNDFPSTSNNEYLTIDESIKTAIEKYKEELNKKNSKQKILNTYKNIHNMIKYLDKQQANSTEVNKMNILNDSINKEQYNYLSLNYYIYVIIVLVVIIILIQITSFV